jgi:uncharacterized membrane protein YgcG
MKRLAALLAPFFLAVSLVMPGAALADANNFTVTNFTADYYLTNADPQGQMRVVEKIAVDFTDQNHGLLRALPKSYKGHPLHLHINKVSSDSGAPVGYTTSTSNGNEVLRIGNPNQTVTGNQEYTIDYNVQNVITFYGGHDELYWDVNGDQWDQPFKQVSAVLHMPTGLQMWSQAPKCYTGSYGSADQLCSIGSADHPLQLCGTQAFSLPSPTANCDPPFAAGDIIADASNLSPHATLTVVIGFRKGYFRPMNFGDYLRDYAVDTLELTVPIIVLGGSSFTWWLKRGRDAKGKGTIVPQYDAPDDMKPIEVGALIDFQVDNRDLTATIIDLAIRKYLKIIEAENKKLLVIKDRYYMLELLNRNWNGLNDWERQIMEGIFGGAAVHDSVTLSAMATKLHATATSLKRSVASSLTSRGYFASNPTKFVTLGVVPAVVVIWIGVSLFSTAQVWLMAGISAGLLLGVAFWHFLPARTTKGVAAKEHILGLKLYLEVAQKDRIAMLQSPNAPYAPPSDGPARTVELFEKLLPYAIVLQVEQQWAKKFKDIYATPPDWYAGNYTAFSTGYLVGMLSDGFAPAVNTSFAAPSSSSGSGFGGGFAGGGGGGGGGGGW